MTTKYNSVVLAAPAVSSQCLSIRRKSITASIRAYSTLQPENAFFNLLDEQMEKLRQNQSQVFYNKDEKFDALLNQYTQYTRQLTQQELERIQSSTVEPDTSSVRQQIESSTLQMITLCSHLSNRDDRVLRTLSIVEQCQNCLFQLLKPQYKQILSYLSESHSHLTSEDIIPVFFEDLALYDQSIDTYVINEYYEQAYELFESIRKQFAIQTKTNALIQRMNNQSEQGEASTTSTTTLDSTTEQAENKSSETEPTVASSSSTFSSSSTLTSEKEQQLFQQQVQEATMFEAIEAAEEQQLVYAAQADSLEAALTKPEESELLQIPLFTNMKTYESLITAFSAIGKLKPIISVFHFMANNELELNRHTFEIILSAFAANSHVSGVLHYLEEMTSRNIQLTADTCAIVLQSFLESNDERFKSVYDAMVQGNNIQWNKRLFQVYVLGLCNISKDTETAIQLVTENMNKSVNDVPLVDIGLCNKVLKACVENRDVMKGMELYAQILNNNEIMTPDMSTFNLVLRLFAVVGDKRTLALFLKFQTDSKDPNSIFASFVPNVETYNALIEMHVQNNDLNGAKNILKLMKTSGLNPNVVSHNLLIKLHHESWQPKLARNKKKSIFDQYIQRSTKPVSAAAVGDLGQGSEEPNMFDFLEVHNVVEEKELLESLISETDITEDPEFH